MHLRNPHRPTALLALSLILCSCTQYDHDIPDTAANKAGYTARLGVAPGPDVTGIFFYADEMGSDCKYMLRFACAQGTVDAIAAKLDLTNTARLEPRLKGRDDLPWWREKDLDALPIRWKANPKNDYFRILWYDATKGEAFFLEYSI